MVVSYDKAEKEYRFKIKHGKVHIKKYLGNGSKVIIPEFVEDMPVTKIDWWAFHLKKSITEVVIPRTVKYIEYGAFGLCENLKKATFSSKVYLNGAVFVGSGLEEVEGLEYITGNVSNRNFFDCTPFIEKTDILICGDKLVKCSTKEEVYRVPSNIKSIGCRAFFRSPVKEVILPEGLKEIHNWAFENTKIRSFKIPDSVEVLGGSICGDNTLSPVSAMDKRS